MLRTDYILLMAPKGYTLGLNRKGKQEYMDGDSIPRGLIYAQVEPEHIADVNWIMEGYEYLANVGTVDGATGILKFAVTPDTYNDVLDVLENMPFKVNLLDSFVD